MHYDYILRNGTLIDGTEQPRRRADLAISGGTIAAIGDLTGATARETIDVSGLIVAPGFIDTHVHSDLMLLWDRQHTSGLYQGVTTEILGQDGLSYAPLSPDNLRMYAKYLAGLNGLPPIPLNWQSVREYRMLFDGTTAINTAYQVPHGALRLETVGMKDVPLTGAALDEAKRLLEQGLQEGAVAFSTGLSYFPCSYSDTDELVELCKVVAAHGSVYVTHIRTVFRDKPIDPVLETIEIGERSGAKIHFSHFRTNHRTLGKVDEVMRNIDAAYERGVDLSLELYPYLAGSGPAKIFLPPWAVEDGYEATLERLADPKLRQALIEGIEQNTIACIGRFAHLPKTPQYIGRSFADVARERGQSVPDMMCDLLLENELQVGIVNAPTFDEDDLLDRFNRDLLELLSRPYYMVGSDAIPVGRQPHPRAYGTFPRLLRLCREYDFSLETMINRMTKTPSERFGLTDRGVLQQGKAADIVVFDAETVTDTATYDTPRSAPVGIEYVFVNGEPAVRNGKATGVFNGRALARQDA